MAPRLGVNIDHIATLRNARGTFYPDPIASINILMEHQVDQITCHLREDRRHIKDDDVKRFIQSKSLPINLEMALTEEMVNLACDLKPKTCTIVPEKREEITTEGGLDIIANFNKLKKLLPKIKDSGIKVSLFVDPDLEQISQLLELPIEAIELHTGTYCEEFHTSKKNHELARLKQAALFSKENNLEVYAGHGLNIENLKEVVSISEIEEYNIGHSIIARSIFIGLGPAIKEIQDILNAK